MLTLERGMGWSIYSLGGEEVHGLRPFTARRQAEPDVRASGRMSGLTAIASVGSGAWHRISGHLAGCPGWGRMSGAWSCRAAGLLRVWALQGPDVRGLEAVLGSFRWFSSSVNLATCSSS